MRFSLKSCSNQESAEFPGADSRGPETLREPPGIPAVDLGRVGPAAPSSPHTPPSPRRASLRAPRLTQGRVLCYLPFTVLRSSGSSSSGGSLSESSDTSGSQD